MYARQLDGRYVNLSGNENYTVRRVHPSRVGKTYHKNDGGKLIEAKTPKYISHPGQGLRSYPNQQLISVYQRGEPIESLAFIEGYFKAATLGLNGLPTAAFLGIGVYKLDNNLRAAITKLRPKVIPIVYDADALDVRRDKATGLVTSQRRQNFCASASKFAEDIFKHLRDIGHRAKVYWCCVNPRQGYKGADDLLNSLTDDQKQAAISQLSRGRNGEYWQTIKLSRTTFSEQLNNLFELDSPYRFYASQRGEIKSEPFTWNGLNYQSVNGVLVMRSDPYRTDIASCRTIQVGEYLKDASNQLDRLIDENDQLAIQAPTGIGKTTFLVNWAKRTGRKLVLCTHTRSLCKQVGEGHDLLAIYGTRNIDRAADAAASQIVVCTYDTVHHLPDLGQRTLVIDEAHNLVNQYGATEYGQKLFRAEAINRLMFEARNAQKVVYLSGTMPLAMLQVLGVPLLNVNRKKDPRVMLSYLVADSGKRMDLTNALLSQLVDDLKDKNKVHFALYNSTEQIELIRQELVSSGRLKKDEIQLFSRSHYDAGKTTGFDDLVELEVIREGVRLVLCTCIIAEGVNIKNTNVGKVYSVGVKCPDTIRQFAARFRCNEVTDLSLILGSDNSLNWQFKFSGTEEIQLGITEAKLRLKSLGIYPRRLGMESNSRPKLLGAIMPTADGSGFEIDNLLILANTRARKVRFTPPSYILGRLLEYGGFEMHNALSCPLDMGVVEDLNAARERSKAIKSETLLFVREELGKHPETLVAALHARYKKKGNRHGTQELERLANHWVKGATPLEVLSWSNEFGHILREKDARELIRRAAKIHFAGIEDAGPLLKMWQRNWNRLWAQIQTHYGLKAIQIAGRKVPAGLKLDLMAKRKIKKHIDTQISIGDAPSYDVDLVNIVRGVIGGKVLTRAKALSIVEQIYPIKTKRQANRKRIVFEKRSLLDEVLMNCSALNGDPLKISELVKNRCAVSIHAPIINVNPNSTASNSMTAAQKGAKSIHAALISVNQGDTLKMQQAWA